MTGTTRESFDPAGAVPLPAPRGRARYIVPVVGVAISAAALVWALHSIDWSRTGATLRGVDPWLLGAGVVLGTFGTFAFAARWRGLLSEHIDLPVRTAYAFIMIGYLANYVLPLRLGDVARAALLGRRFRVSGVIVLGSIALERVLDVVTLLAFAVTLSSFVPMPAQARASIALIGGCGMLGLLGLLVLARNPSMLDRLGARFAHVPGWTRVMGPTGLLRRLVAGLGALHDMTRLAAAAALSVVAWTFAGLSVYIWLSAFHLAVPWYAAVSVLVVTNLGGAIPSTPGAIGVYHSLAMFALAGWVKDRSARLAYAIGSHAVSLSSSVIIGAACLARQHVSLRSLANASPSAELER